MVDLTIELQDQPGALAQMGRILGQAGISIEGGGMWVVDGRGIAHYLVEDATSACVALQQAGIPVSAAREVVMQRLRQGVPGQLGELSARMATAGVNIEVQYSDHAGQLVLVVDDLQKGRAVSEAWMLEQRR
jgi:hypothetical protein